MNQIGTRWLALAGAMLLLALSVSGAFAARPQGLDANRGSSVSSFVLGLVFGDTPETDDDVTGLDEVDADEVDAALAGEHGSCVSAVARDKGAVGGEHENHGGAVSEAARETCWSSEEDVTEVDEESTGEGEDASVSSSDTTDVNEAGGSGRPSHAGKPDGAGGSGQGRGSGRN